MRSEGGLGLYPLETYLSRVGNGISLTLYKFYQINGYTGTTYWVTFAVIATLSFLSLFFFSRLLMIVSDVLDEKIHQVQKSSWKTIKHGLRGKGKNGTDEDEAQNDKGRDSD